MEAELHLGRMILASCISELALLLRFQQAIFNDMIRLSTI